MKTNHYDIDMFYSKGMILQKVILWDGNYNIIGKLICGSNEAADAIDSVKITIENLDGLRASTIFQSYTEATIGQLGK